MSTEIDFSEYDESYFETIDSPMKAYMLGLVIYNLKHNDDTKKILSVEISIDENVKCIKYNNYFRNIDKIKRTLSKLGNCVYNLNNNIIVLTITSPSIIASIHKHFGVSSLSFICDMDISHFLDNTKDPVIQNQFVKAYIEKYGNITHENNDSKLYITFYQETNLDKITNLYNIPFIKNKLFNLNIAIYNNVNVIDLMGLLYSDDTIPYINLKLYDNFYRVFNNDNENVLPQLKVFRTSETAVMPSKCRASDVGYDLTIIKECKVLNASTRLYDTGIKLDIPNGYYVEIVPRSSLSKSGYMLANSVGIIDQSYRGNIYVALTKINAESNEPELPWKCCQMIIRKQIYGKITESKEDFDETNRNTGGFGSTNATPATP
jgi:deoxyuridine 5'-triphosphate nucleotidohydrolase